MSNFNNRKALLTGATGYLGSHLAEKLLLEGWDLSIIIRPSSNLGVLHSIIDNITVYCHDGTSEQMLRIMEDAKPDIVFHLASAVIPLHQTSDIHPLIESNISFATQLVDAMVKNGVHRLINTGTSWQHFENMDYNPVSLYAATKQAFEAILTYYKESSPLKVINLKLFDIYGPNDPRPKLISLLLDTATTGKTLDLSPGEQFIDLIHVRDVVQAYLIAANRLFDAQPNQWEDFAVTSSSPIPLKEMVNKLESLLGKPISINWGGRSYREREVMIPWNNGNHLPGWQPEISLEDGLKEVINAISPR